MELIRKNDRVAAIDYIRNELRVASMLEHAIQKINAGLLDPLQAEDVVGPLSEGQEIDSRLSLVA